MYTYIYHEIPWSPRNQTMTIMRDPFLETWFMSKINGPKGPYCSDIPISSSILHHDTGVWHIKTRECLKTMDLAPTIVGTGLTGS